MEAADIEIFNGVVLEISTEEGLNRKIKRLEKQIRSAVAIVTLLAGPSPERTSILVNAASDMLVLDALRMDLRLHQLKLARLG